MPCQTKRGLTISILGKTISADDILEYFFLIFLENRFDIFLENWEQNKTKKKKEYHLSFVNLVRVC